MFTLLSHQLVLATSAYYDAIDFELTKKAREWNELKNNMEKEVKSAKGSKSVFHNQLEKAEKLLKEKDDHISS